MAQKIDKHIGETIKHLRVLKGISQSELGKKVGVSFQQIQKYEKGINKISCSKLYQLANALEEEMARFFVDFDKNDNMLSKKLSLKEDETANFRNEIEIDSKIILNLIRNFHNIKDTKIRNAIYDLIKAASNS